MSLRWKLTLAMAVIAAVTAVAFGTASYRATRERLYAEIDRSLVAVDGIRVGGEGLPARGPLVGYDAQIIDPTGRVRDSTFPAPIPVTDADLALLGARGSRFATVDTDAGSYRVRTVGLPRGAVQIGRSLDETERILASLRARTLLIAALVSALAITLGLWISERVTASLRRLTAAAEHVGSTGRLDVAVGEHGADEVGRLGVAFDGMLAALARSKDEQRRLVQDAGHELRTPLTSLRTNLEALRRYPDMSAEDRVAVLADLHAETQELSTLVDEVVAVGFRGSGRRTGDVLRPGRTGQGDDRSLRAADEPDVRRRSRPRHRGRPAVGCATSGLVPAGERDEVRHDGRTDPGHGGRRCGDRARPRDRDPRFGPRQRVRPIPPLRGGTCDARLGPGSVDRP